jgi:hypothetical protein
MQLNELRDTSFEIAKSKGWHDPEVDTATFGDRIALVMTELAEAMEDHRVGKPPRQIEYIKEGAPPVRYTGDHENLHQVGEEQIRKTAMSLASSGYKPCGIIIELADVVIRLGDLSGRYELNFAAEESSIAQLVDKTDLTENSVLELPTFGEWICGITVHLLNAWQIHEGSTAAASADIASAIRGTCGFAKSLGITGAEFERAIEIKHAFNRTRPVRHGGKKL